MKSEIASFSYDVFISYSRRDLSLARKLQSTLESYVPLAGLGLDPRHLIVFRDETDIRGTRYYRSIDDHLKRSNKLLLICSPDAHRSSYVNDEIERFVRLRGSDEIIPLLYRGKANNETEHEAEKAFPEILVKALETPLAIDLRGFDPRVDEFDAEPWERAWYLLLSNLFGIERRVIEDRDQRRKYLEIFERAKDLWYKAHEDRLAGRQLESVHKLARAYQIAPTSNLKRNLSTALLNAFPKANVQAIWENDATVVDGRRNIDGSRLIVWDNRNRVFGLNFLSGECEFSGISHRDTIHGGIFLSPTVAATYSRDGQLKVFDLEAKSEIATLNHEGPVLTAIAGSYEDGLLAIISSQGVIEPQIKMVLWSWRDASVRFERMLGREIPGWPIFCQDGRRFAFVENKREFKILNRDGKEVAAVQAPSQVLGLWELPDRRILLGCASDIMLAQIQNDGGCQISALLHSEEGLQQFALDAGKQRILCRGAEGSILFVDLVKNKLSQLGKIGDELAGNISFGANNSVALLWGNEAFGMVTVGGDLVWYRPYDFEINPVMDAGIHPEIPAISFQESRLTKVGLYSLTHGNPVCEAFEQPAPINRFISNSKERRAVTIGGDNRVLFWKIHEGDPGRPARTYRRVSHFLQANKTVRIAIADIRGLLCLIDPFEGRQVGPDVRNVRGLRSILLNEQDTVLVGFAREAQFLRWRLEGDLAEPEGVRFSREILAASLAPDWSHDAVMLEDGSIQLVGLGEQLSLQGEIIHKTTGGRLSGFQYSDDGTLMTTWSDDGWIRIWDVKRTQEICTPIALQGIPYGALFDSGVKRLIAWGSGNVVTVKNIEADTEMQLKHFGPGVLLEPGIIQARFSKNGELVFSSSSDKTIRVWDAETGEQILPPFEHRAQVSGFAQSYDDRTLLSWSYDRVLLWDLRTGKRAVKDIQHQDVVAFAFWTFSEDRLVSCDHSNSIQVWDRETGLPVSSALIHPGEGTGDEARVSRVSLSADDKHILSWGKEGTVRVWHLDGGQEALRWKDFVEYATASRLEEGDYEVQWLQKADFEERKARIGENITRELDKAASEARISSSMRLIPSGFLSESMVRQMLQDEEFFDAKLNPAVIQRKLDLKKTYDGEIILDERRGLMWQQGGSDKAVDFDTCLAFLESLNQRRFGGFNDWRLPTAEEAMSLMYADTSAEEMHIAELFDPQQKWIWTLDFAGDDMVWMVSYGWGTCSVNDVRLPAFVRAVRWID